MKIKEVSGYGYARYSELIPEWFGELEFISGECEDGYSGEVNLWGFYEPFFYNIQYYYGSCSGCDDWEYRNLSDDEIQKELTNLIIKYTQDEYDALLERINL